MRQSPTYGFLFRSEFLFRTTREFFCRTKREICFQNITLDNMTKTLNQIIFFFLHQNQNIFFQQHWESEYFFRKKPYHLMTIALKRSRCDL